MRNSCDTRPIGNMYSVQSCRSLPFRSIGTQDDAAVVSCLLTGSITMRNFPFSLSRWWTNNSRRHCSFVMPNIGDFNERTPVLGCKTNCRKLPIFEKKFRCSEADYKRVNQNCRILLFFSFGSDRAPVLVKLPPTTIWNVLFCVSSHCQRHFVSKLHRSPVSSSACSDPFSCNGSRVLCVKTNRFDEISAIHLKWWLLTDSKSAKSKR